MQEVVSAVVGLTLLERVASAHVSVEIDHCSQLCSAVK